MSNGVNGTPVRALDGTVQVVDQSDGTIKPLETVPMDQLAVRPKAPRSASKAAADERGALLTGKQEHCKRYLGFAIDRYSQL